MVDLVASIRGGHCWIAASAEVTLTFEVSAGDRVAGPGDLLVTNGAPVTVAVAVGGVPDGVIRLHTEQGVVVEQAAAELSATVAETGFVWVSVRTPESMAAVANPVVLVDQSPAHPSPSPSRSRADR